MPAKRIIPCLDVTEGRVVKGVRFQELRDAGDPAELAAVYDREGADEIIFLDITASSDARNILLDAVQRLASRVQSPLYLTSGYLVVDEPALPGWQLRTRRELDGWAADLFERDAVS